MAADVCREGLSSRCSGCFWVSVSGTLEADILNFSLYHCKKGNPKKNIKKSQCRHDKVEKVKRRNVTERCPCFDIYTQPIGADRGLRRKTGAWLFRLHCTAGTLLLRTGHAALCSDCLDTTDNSTCPSTTTTHLQTIQFAPDTLCSSPASLNFHCKRRA